MTRPFRTAAKAGATVALVAGLLVAITGDTSARQMTAIQPMKMAAAEALYQTEAPASFSILTIGSLDGRQELFSIRIPDLLSLLATGDPNGKVEGINDIQAAYQASSTGPGDYVPYVPVTYWTFRLMIGLGVLAAAAAAWLLWCLRRGRRPVGRLRRRGGDRPAVPAACWPTRFGWIFTEMGRQPWIVFGLMQTSAGVTPGRRSAFEVLLTLVVFTLLYGGLAVVEVGLLLRRIRAGLPEAHPKDEGSDLDQPLTLRVLRSARCPSRPSGSA